MADGKITVEVSTQAVQAELERLRHENARLAREAHTWWTACAGATEELERLRDAIGRHPPSERQGLTDEQIEKLRGLDTDKRVRFYEHDFYVLSNFSAFTLHWFGCVFQTSEAAYHYEKFPTRHDIGAEILHAPSAHEAFKIAERNRAHRRPDWDEVKVSIMRDILRAKAAQHEYVRRKLLDTGDRELVEDSWRDDFWGWGPNRDGQNMLGKLWMEIRAELRAHGIGTESSVGRTYTQADLLEAVEAERHACSICVWMVLQDALEPGADDKGLEGWMREAEQRVKNRLAHHDPPYALQAQQPVPADGFCWLVEEFGPDGSSTGRYMLDQGALTITSDVCAARRFRRWQSAGFRALDMKAQHKGDWRAVEHGFGMPLPAAPGHPPSERQPPTDAARDVLAERRRQVEVEGWTPEHDDAHSSGDLMQAAICYAMGATFVSGATFDLWPWDRAWWKPKDRRSNLVRATALLLAEIERLDRARGIVPATPESAG